MVILTVIGALLMTHVTMCLGSVSSEHDWTHESMRSRLAWFACTLASLAVTILLWVMTVDQIIPEGGLCK